ncbi:MAG: hypothetical protein ACTSRI_14200 [Promethearchaeota archaeon]
MNERINLIKELVSSSITFSNEIAESGEYFEAGELLYSAAEFLEDYDLDFSQALELYNHVVQLWEKEIKSYKNQAKLHEVAEIYLKIANIYSEKFQDLKLEKKAILNSISFLISESKLLKDFNDMRKLCQNFLNIAELYIKFSDFKNAIRFYLNVIEITKDLNYFELLSHSYQQIASCYEELDDYNKSKEIILDGIDFFLTLFTGFEEKNDNLAIAQTSHILKRLYDTINNKDQFVNYSKKEAGAYINLAESIEKNEENYQKIATYYRGAGLCYQEINNNLIESASCFILAGNYSEKIEDYQKSALNFFNAANVFKNLNNLEMAYKHFIKAGDNFWKIDDVNKSTENYLNAYDIAVEGNLEFNRFGIFSQIIRGLNKVAKEGLKNKQFYTAATLILESIKFYEQLDTAKDFLLREMVRNVYKYYYRAANLKKISYSHIVQSYVLASISCILNGKIDKAWEVISEIDSEGYTINNFKKIIEMIINWVSRGQKVELENFPYNLRRLIEKSEEIMFLMKLFRGFKLKHLLN